MTGIPISVALKTFSERDTIAERHKFFAPIKTPEHELAEAEEALIRSIEQDFHEEAEALLDRFQMSHLRLKTNTPQHRNTAQ